MKRRISELMYFINCLTWSLEVLLKSLNFPERLVTFSTYKEDIDIDIFNEIKHLKSTHKTNLGEEFVFFSSTQNYRQYPLWSCDINQIKIPHGILLADSNLNESRSIYLLLSTSVYYKSIVH